MTLFLAWLVANLLLGLLSLTHVGRFVAAAGWLLLGLLAVLVGWPVLITAAALRRLGLEAWA